MNWWWPFKQSDKRVRVEQGTGTSWLANMIQLLMGPRSSAGIHINEDKALGIAAVYTAVRIIGGTIGSLPLHVFRRDERGGRVPALTHWAYPLLHDAPNEYHTSFTWRELLVTHLLLWGNSYNRIEWLNNGSAGALLPLMPWDVTPRLTSGGAKFYQVSLPDGKEDLADDEVLHVPGLSYDGLRGMSVIGKLRDSLGLAKAAEDLAGGFFANGAKVGGILEVPGKMDPEAQKNLVESLAEKFTGKDGAFKALVLEEGAKFHGPNMMPLKDAQFIEIRKYQRSEIFGWYGVPPHLGGDTERSTSWGTGIEQQDIGYAKHTITPLCVRIEQECNRKLFRRGSGLYVKHGLDGLLRGDFKSRMEGLQIAVGRPWMSAAEAREFEELNRKEGLDEVAMPLNTGTSGKGGTSGGAAPAPSASGEDDDMRNLTVNVAPPAVTVTVGESTEERRAREVAERTRDEARTREARDLVRTANSAAERTAAALEAQNKQLERIADKQLPRPMVHVDAHNRVDVKVPAADVNVHLPERKTVSVIERVGGNREGDIERVTQTEKDA